MPNNVCLLARAEKLCLFSEQFRRSNILSNDVYRRSWIVKIVEVVDIYELKVAGEKVIIK